MWLEIQKYPPYFINFVKKHEDYYVFVTNYVKIWTVNYTEMEFLDCLQKSNLKLEMEQPEFLEKGTQMLLNPTNLKSINIVAVGTVLKVFMTMLYDFNFKLNIELEEGSPELFFSKVTQPLLKIIHDLRSSEQKLRTIISKKDDEIDEYKSLGGNIRYTALPPHNDRGHMEEHSAYECNFGNINISGSILELTVQAPEEIKKEVIEEHKCIKTECLSQEIKSEATKNKINIKNEHNIKSESKSLIPTKVVKKKRLNL